jgi:hypothetical protein
MQCLAGGVFNEFGGSKKKVLPDGSTYQKHDTD